MQICEWTNIPKQTERKSLIHIQICTMSLEIYENFKQNKTSHLIN